MHVTLFIMLVSACAVIVAFQGDSGDEKVYYPEDHHYHHYHQHHHHELNGDEDNDEAVEFQNNSTLEV